MESEIRVALVEDNVAMAEGTRTGLELEGYNVVGIAASGQQAIDLAEKTCPDVIIMDINIAGPMDGIEAADIIYKRFQTPIVFLTACSDDARVARARGVGACGYLVKPYRMTELKAMLEVTHYKAKADRALQEMQARAQKLEKAESLARMAGAVAHNYNNALTGVTCNLELALEMIPADAPFQDLIKSAHEQSIQAANLGLKMLDYVGQTFCTNKDLNFAALCKHYLSDMGESFNIKADIPDYPLMVCFNPDQLKHVLDVLLRNARESLKNSADAITLQVGQADGSIIPTQIRVPVDFEPLDMTYAYLEVADTGCGIAAKDIEKVFEPFYSTKFAGRGLGLASAVGLIKANEGCITVRSQPGQGSRFRVWLPVAASNGGQSIDYPDAHHAE